MNMERIKDIHQKDYSNAEYADALLRFLTLLLHVLVMRFFSF